MSAAETAREVSVGYECIKYQKQLITSIYIINFILIQFFYCLLRRIKVLIYRPDDALLVDGFQFIVQFLYENQLHTKPKLLLRQCHQTLRIELPGMEKAANSGEKTGKSKIMRPVRIGISVMTL
jgi:hypothetical protein